MNRAQEADFAANCGATYHVPGQRRPNTDRPNTDHTSSPHTSDKEPDHQHKDPDHKDPDKGHEKEHTKESKVSLPAPSRPHIYSLSSCHPQGRRRAAGGTGRSGEPL